VTRARGFTLVELMVAVSVLGVVLATMGGVAATLHREERTSNAYVEDLAGLRRAVRAVEADLRLAATTDDLDVRLEGGVLYRGGSVLARNVALFEVAEAGDGLARVRIGLGRRSDAPHRRDAVLDLRVRLRGKGGAR